MLIESDNYRRRSKVSRPVGSGPFYYLRPLGNTLKAVMVWGALCEGHGLGPFFIWERETLPEKKELNYLLIKENKENCEIVDA
jgi:hypothetical protein